MTQKVSADMVSGGMFAPGDIKLSARQTPEAGWLLCDGSNVDRIANAGLFEAIGVAFGAGDGVNTFTLPDARGKFPVGAAAAYPLASMGGAAEVALVPSNLPAHTHNLGVANTFAAGGTETAAVPVGSGDATATSSVGLSTPFSTLPPYLGLNVFIKT